MLFSRILLFLCDHRQQLLVMRIPIVDGIGASDMIKEEIRVDSQVIRKMGRLVGAVCEIFITRFGFIKFSRV